MTGLGYRVVGKSSVTSTLLGMDIFYYSDTMAVLISMCLYLIELLPRLNIHPSIPPVLKKQTIIMGLCRPTILEENLESDVSIEILADFPLRQTNKDDHIIDITSCEEEFNANEAICLPKIKEKQREVSVQSFLGCPPSHNIMMKTKLGCLQPNEKKRKSPSPKLFNAGIQETEMKFQKLETKVNVVSSSPEFRRKKFYLNHVVFESSIDEVVVLRLIHCS